MARQILIIDAVATNRIVLKVKLTGAFYDVAQAVTAAEALDSLRRSPVSLIIIGGLEDMSPVDLCARLRSLRATAHCPILLLSADAGAETRLAALRAGANSILEQPCCDALLLARVRSLLRSTETESELRLREGTHRALGLSEPKTTFEAPGRIGFIAEDRRGLAGRIAALRQATAHRIEMMAPRDIFEEIRGQERSGQPPAAPDALVIALGARDPDADLQILPDLRARLATRYCGVLILAPDPGCVTAAAALDLGADDVAPLDISVEEIALRVDRLLKRKRMEDRLRSTVREGLRAAVTDPLTGLFNRRYAMPHLARIAERAARVGRPFAIMVADLDHFKQVNDRFGHAAGDAVLAEVARRLRENLRAVDLVARIGGEEFLIALPDASGPVAGQTAQRLCAAMADVPFDIPGHPRPIPMTVSIGVTLAHPDGDTSVGGRDPGTAPDRQAATATAPRLVPDLRPETLLRRADAALYIAKSHGRNKVELGRPAA